MAENKDGGRVYACIDENYFQEGISRRDWLAGMAMQGICGNANSIHLTPEQISDFSEKIADAMIARGGE